MGGVFQATGGAIYFFFLNNISFKLMNIKQFNGNLVMMVHMAQYTDAGLAG